MLSLPALHTLLIILDDKQTFPCRLETEYRVVGTSLPILSGEADVHALSWSLSIPKPGQRLILHHPNYYQHMPMWSR